ncbi:MAG: AbrB/MazE/SpoVT family DNA-binding domain-containing protein [Deltaproteobacteria bacterium]|mgnify:FL=1|jgi:antitoxin PrlF|nr:AbrB/MazE/SpoVT family DNA-binding domain-containing protein [Deltaproteobacteria bacterium]MBT4089184.1 AbrB/MazE/SpoVT family DNA-binding domain-containing protein [Deltaproteobacteria bacterium]MBT4264975.1 AbrB/MazE/SpoVT family DNA-binding domain-containing protein [Deltaproteobacteria bacterium]MBT4638507.1 AbrB/MazE/SpoVT family DNA-binding domain-containing protein [Deltaproteobacteria bacterium]MBT6504547.1 AbrB/MazE/SpoVT family DNA-binding domain-containing protein [Deltaproteobac
MKAIVADRGQVTIPKKIRDRLGIVPQTVLEFHEENGKLIAVKATEEDPVVKVIGCLKIENSTDEIMKELRDGE